MSKNTQVAVKEEAAISTQVVAPKGFDNFDMDDLIVPRVRLLQALSEAVSAGSGRPGEFQDSLTGETIGTSLEVVLLNYKNGAVYFKAGEGMVCKSNDGINNTKGQPCNACPFNEFWGAFHEDGTPPACSGSKEFLIVKRESLKETPYPMLLSFIKSSYPMGKKLISMARLTGEDIYARSYVISSKQTKNNKGTFSVMEIKPGAKLSQEEVSKAAIYHNMFAKTKIIAHDDTEFMTDV